MRPFLSARTYDGYAFPADDPRDHRIFPICRKVKALSKYNQAYQLLEYQTCKDWRRLSLKLTSTPPPPIPALFNYCNRYATKRYRAHMTSNTYMEVYGSGSGVGKQVADWSWPGSSAKNWQKGPHSLPQVLQSITKHCWSITLPPSSITKVLLKYHTPYLGRRNLAASPRAKIALRGRWSRSRSTCKSGTKAETSVLWPLGHYHYASTSIFW